MSNAGIYMIVNKVNGKRYVGSSRNCHRRKSEHLSRLRRNAHINSKLQAAWNKYGITAESSVSMYVRKGRAC